MSYQLRFEYKDGEWKIYLLGRVEPIGDIRPTLGTARWFGRLSLDGRKATFIGDNPQSIVDKFESWVAAGTPPDTELLTRKGKSWASVSADVWAKLRLRDISNP